MLWTEVLRIFLTEDLVQMLTRMQKFLVACHQHREVGHQHNTFQLRHLLLVEVFPNSVTYIQHTSI